MIALSKIYKQKPPVEVTNTSCMSMKFTLCGLALFMLSCNSHREIHPAPDSTEFRKGKVIRFHQDSVVSYKNKVAVMRNIAKNLGLHVLIGGYQGLYMRIWAWDSRNKSYVIDLKRSSSGSACSVLFFTGTRHDSVSYLSIDGKINVTPESGWAFFFKSLEKFDMPEMPIEKLSKEQKYGFSGLRYVQIEVDQPNQYRYLEYADPFYFRKEDSASEKIFQFIMYFNKEMNAHIYDVEKNDSGATKS